MELHKLNKEWIEKVLAAIPFVKWDRFIDVSFNDERILDVFGWIYREKDNYADFVVLEFNIKKQEVFFIATSSQEHSPKIAEILGSGHTPCRRIEDCFNITNSIKLQ